MSNARAIAIVYREIYYRTLRNTSKAPDRITMAMANIVSLLEIDDITPYCDACRYFRPDDFKHGEPPPVVCTKGHKPEWVGLEAMQHTGWGYKRWRCKDHRYI